MMFCSQVSAQDFTATGTVSDSGHEPLIGASVSVVGGKVGAITDIDGKFRLSAPAGAKFGGVLCWYGIKDCYGFKQHESYL